MPVCRSAVRRANRKDRGFATSPALLAKPRTQRVVMPGRRDAWHVLLNSLLVDGAVANAGSRLGTTGPDLGADLRRCEPAATPCAAPGNRCYGA
jgi:hypothetical protein